MLLLIWKARFDDASHNQLHIAQSDIMQTIFEREHLTLLGDAQPSIHCAGRLAENGLIDGAAAAPNRTSAPMKHCNTNAAAFPKLSEAQLSAVQFPGRGQDAAVFATIRIAQHHLLFSSAALQIGGIRRMSKSLLKHSRTVVEIIDGLE